MNPRRSPSAGLDKSGETGNRRDEQKCRDGRRGKGAGLQPRLALTPLSERHHSLADSGLWARVFPQHRSLCTASRPHSGGAPRGARGLLWRPLQGQVLRVARSRRKPPSPAAAVADFSFPGSPRSTHVSRRERCFSGINTANAFGESTYFLLK